MPSRRWKTMAGGLRPYPPYKTIDGKSYQAIGAFNYKPDATRHAKIARSSNLRASVRVIKVSGFWVVYWRVPG